MDLLVIRHADAVPLNVAGHTVDEERPLTEVGRQQAKRLGLAFRLQGLAPEIVLSSPLVRAKQTAEGLMGALELSDDKLEIRDELSPGGRLKRMGRLALGLTANIAAMIGHEPDLSQFVAWLLGDKEMKLHIPKAGVVWLRGGFIDKGDAELIALLPPEMFLRGIA